mmetsp:Transcript_14793/g.32163  ORF Transcript_14793/g.32163 Transcript_14793/m.32163 type:complete len:114 (+) Transcript_14793:463-804(+)
MKNSNPIQAKRLNNQSTRQGIHLKGSNESTASNAIRGRLLGYHNGRHVDFEDHGSATGPSGKFSKHRSLVADDFSQGQTRPRREGNDEACPYYNGRVRGGRPEDQLGTIGGGR